MEPLCVRFVIAIAEGLKRGISMESMDMPDRVVEHTLNLSITEGFNFKEQAEQLQRSLAESERVRKELAEEFESFRFNSSHAA